MTRSKWPGWSGSREVGGEWIVRWNSIIHCLRSGYLDTRIQHFGILPSAFNRRDEYNRSKLYTNLRRHYRLKTCFAQVVEEIIINNHTYGLCFKMHPLLPCRIWKRNSWEMIIEIRSQNTINCRNCTIEYRNFSDVWLWAVQKRVTCIRWVGALGKNSFPGYDIWDAHFHRSSVIDQLKS